MPGMRGDEEKAVRKQKILVVDDDARLSDLVATYLGRAGYEAVLSEDGPSALGKLASGGISLMVLDLMMPCMDGLEDGRIEVRISDDGRWIVDEERKSVFEYFRTGRASPRGSGIGLALARQYVLAHGGTISCLEAQGGGTCFAIVI